MSEGRKGPKGPGPLASLIGSPLTGVATMFDGLIGSIVSGIGGVIQNKMNQDFAADQASLNRDFQAQMSNTAWRRGMEDMKLAGLNPILAYQKGPASSPTGAPAATSVTNVGQAMVEAYNNSARTSVENERTGAETVRSGAETKKTLTADDLLKQEIENAKATNEQIKANTAKSIAEASKTAVDTDLSRAMIPRVQYDTAKTWNEAEKVKFENSARSVDEAFYKSSLGRGTRMFGNFLSEINPLKGLFGGMVK